MGDRFNASRGRSRRRTSGRSQPESLIEVKMDGLGDMEDFFDDLGKELQEKSLRRAFRAGAKVLQERAIELVPRSSPEDTRSGENKDQKESLWQAIKVRMLRPSGAGRMLSIMQVSVQHRLAHLAEYGTLTRFHKSGKGVGYMPASSFIRKSVDEKGAESVATITETLRTTLERLKKRYERKAAQRRKKAGL